MKKLIAFFITLSFLSITLSQSNYVGLSGKITDNNTGEPLPFTNILLSQNNKTVYGVSSDFDGKYNFKNIKAGIYTLTANFVGYEKFKIIGVKIDTLKTQIIDVKLKTGNEDLKEVVVISTCEVKRMPIRNTISRIASIRRSRAKTNSYYIDGIKIRGNSESYDKINENKFLKVKKEPLSTFSIDVDKASYSNMRRFINQNQLPPKDAVRIEEMINYFDYDYPQPTGKHPFSITTEYTDCPWNEKNKLVSIALQGKEIDMEKAPANNLVFLLDVSGSMNSYNKLGLLKSGLELLIDELREKDKVSIVVYAGAAGVVLKPTHGDNKEKIKKALNQLQAGGSTAGGQGIELAYKIAKKYFIKNGNNRVILATDGDFNVGISDDDELIKLIETKRDQDIFLSVLGFGTGNYKDSKMEKIANKGNGNYAYIDNILEAKKVLVKEMGGTLLTIAKDVKLQIEFNPTHVKSYRLIGYENRKLENEDFNDDKKDAGELGSGHTVTALYEIVPASNNDEIEVDNLKYQETPLINKNTNPNEILTVKFRYKEPKETESKLITHVVYDEYNQFENASNNLKFSVSVIEFGMILRDSKYKGNSNFNGIIKLAKKSKGKDDEGYRAEFIKLVETAELLKRKDLVLEKE